MSQIYEIRSTSKNGKPHYWGARHTLEEAEAKLVERSQGKNLEWARKYHERWWIEEIDTTGCFVFPPKPVPRDIYSVHTNPVECSNGGRLLDVEILDMAQRVIGTYQRNHGGFYQTFEPFRQGNRMFALIAPDYTATSVMDLQTGKIIASETPDSNGFCPAGFYVPDWWDVHDDSILPGSHGWKDQYEQPTGRFGFVWGCIWGDDSCWKVQYLDLSSIESGKLKREDRFGYLELDNDPEAHTKTLISLDMSGKIPNVEFRTRSTFELNTGKLIDPFE